MKTIIYILKLKIKSIIKPIKIEFPDESYIKLFFSDLISNKEFINVGPIAFRRDDFIYAYYEEKEVR